MSQRSAATVPPDDDTTRAPSGDHWWRDGLRPLVARIHFYAGMFIAPFIVIAAVTGVLYALTPQIERVVYRDTLTVEPVGQPLPLAQQVDAAIDQVPDGTVAAVRPATGPQDVTRVSFESPTAPEDRRLTAFVNPYTADVIDVLPTFGEWLPLRTWFDDLHRNLHLGEVGRVYSELAASWLWVLALSGIGLWTVRRWRRGQVRRLVIPPRGGQGRGKLTMRHGALGVWLLLGMLFLSATGLTWSHFAGDNVASVREQLDWATPSVATPASPAIADGDVPEAVELVAASAVDAGLSGPIEVVPGTDGAAWKVSQVKRSWPAQQDSVSVDPTTGAILDRIDFADWSLAAKLARWGIDAHMGILFGLANQIALALLAIGLVTTILLGYRMWWRRRPTRRRAAYSPGAVSTSTRGYAGPLGGAKPPNARALFILAVVGIAAGIFLPVLGASLLIFLAMDTVLHTIRARRATPYPVTE